jgi:uncharacterized protein YdeI (YjbR/CyaY-like superfamily)
VDNPVVFETSDDWHVWLTEHHTTSTGVWIKFAKKGSGQRSITYREALDLALRHGWIDGQAGSVDEQWYRQRFSPRTKRSKWSRINTERATELIEAGLMTPAGLAAVDAAKADGRWAAAYEPPSTITVPDDLRAALDAQPEAAAFFATLSSQNRYAILFRVHEAKRPETRAKRIEKFVAMCARGETLH